MDGVLIAPMKGNFSKTLATYASRLRFKEEMADMTCTNGMHYK